MYSLISPYIMATLGKKGSGHCKEGAIVQRFKHEESMHELSAKKSGHCREVVVVER